MLSLQSFALALFSISLGAKGLLSTHSLASFVIDLSSFNQVGIFFLKVSNSNLSLIVHRWTECCFTQCIVKSHAYPLVYFFQPRATLCNWATRQIFLFECDQSMLWLPIVEHRARAFLTYCFKKRFIKNIGRFPFSQNFRNFRFGGKWNTFCRFVPLENSQKKWKI